MAKVQKKLPILMGFKEEPELVVEDTEGAGMRILPLTNCLEAGPEGAHGGGEAGRRQLLGCCLPSGLLGQL